MKLRQEQLDSHLNKNLAPVYFVSGDEPLLLQESCDAIKAKARATGFEERQLFFAEPGFNWQTFEAAWNNLSLFSSKTLIELRLNAKPGTIGAKALQKYCNNPPQDKLLLLVSEKIDAATLKSKWVKAIDNSGIIMQVWPIPAGRLAPWIGARLRSLGLNTTNTGINLIVNYVEGNLLAATQEITKLKLLYGEGSLTEQQIKDAITDNSRFNIFDFADIFLSGNLARTLHALHSLKAEKVQPTLILWAVTRELRDLIKIHSFIEQGDTVDQAMLKQKTRDKRKPIIKHAIRSCARNKTYKLLKICVAIDRTIKGVDQGSSWDKLEMLCWHYSK